MFSAVVGLAVFRLPRGNSREMDQAVPAILSPCIDFDQLEQLCISERNVYEHPAEDVGVPGRWTFYNRFAL